MALGRREDIEKREMRLVFVDSLRWDITSDYLAKNTITHELMLIERFVGGQ